MLYCYFIILHFNPSLQNGKAPDNRLPLKRHLQKPALFARNSLFVLAIYAFYLDNFDTRCDIPEEACRLIRKTLHGNLATAVQAKCLRCGFASCNCAGSTAVYQR